jgi:hypothetical protein
MALRLSAGLRNFLNQGGSLKRAFVGGELQLYSGSQPADANTAVAGTLLCTYTDASGARTKEVRAVGSFTISGTSGSVDTIKLAFGGGTAFDILGGAVTNTGNVNTTADAVAAAINNSRANLYVRASTTGSSGVVTLTALPGLGAFANGWVISGTSTTTSLGTFVDIGTGVAGVTSVNGLRFTLSSGGVLIKDPNQVWTGVAGATNTAGWFRLVSAINDPGSTDSSETYIRLDGNVSTSGANLNLSSTTITSGATQTITTFQLTEPAN